MISVCFLVKPAREFTGYFDFVRFVVLIVILPEFRYIVTIEEHCEVVRFHASIIVLLLNDDFLHFPVFTIRHRLRRSHVCQAAFNVNQHIRILPPLTYPPPAPYFLNNRYHHLRFHVHAPTTKRGNLRPHRCAGILLSSVRCFPVYRFHAL